MQEHNDATVKSSLDRLLLCNQIRELTDYPKPVTVADLSRTRGLLARIASLAYGSSRPLPSSNGVWRRTIIYPLIIVMIPLLLHRWRNWRGILSNMRLVYRNMHRNQLSSSEITGYVSCTDKEEPLVRVCQRFRVHNLTDNVLVVKIRILEFKRRRSPLFSYHGY